MTNTAIAALLGEIADLLEIADENPFKVRSYRRAAEALEGLGEEAAALHARGELETIPGVGKGLAEKIAEYLDTGAIGYHRELLARYPETLLELLAIPGLGPKHVGQVFRELGIATVEELEAAARARRLRELKGMGAKSEEKLLRGIALLREGQERTLLGVALPLAQELVEELRAREDVSVAQMAGSVRRRRETIGDLDLLAISERPAAVCEAFAQGREVLVAGDTKVSVRLEPGINCDLRCVPPESYGAALLYFTGSKQHNIELRERAQRMGMTLNEYGLYEETDGQTGRMVAGATEEEVYAALGLQYIEPELREARGEIAAAEQGDLPLLIEPGQIQGDLQMHTTGSDGRNSLEEMADACRALGYRFMGITDHSPALGVAGGQSGDRLRAQIEAIHALNSRLAAEGADFEVLAGIEADILGDGRLDVPGGLWDELDYVIGSIHQGFTSDADRMTARILTAIESGQMDIFAHPTGRLLLEREPYGIHIEPVIEAAVRHDVALEINASPHRLDLNDAHARLAQSRGAKLSINTDAHRADHLAFMPFGVMTARRGWVEAKTVINTWDRRRLRTWLGKRRGN
jgi:DNA polymerase (family 10)